MGERWNIWDCEVCGEPTLCVEIDDGVTPFMLKCRATPGCVGMAESRFYPKGPRPDLPIRGEWYRPTREETATLTFSMATHVINGGLILREKGKREARDG